jgi:lipoprotein-releasing system permease protein
MKYLSLLLYIKYLRSGKLMLLSIAAVAMSSALLIVVASLFTGFINAIESTAVDTVGDVVIDMAGTVKIGKYDQLIKSLEQNPVIKSATGVLDGQGLLWLGKGNVRAVKIWGIELQKRALVTPFADTLHRQKGSAGNISFAMDNADAADCGFLGIGVAARPDEVTDEYDEETVEQYIGKKVRLTTGSAQLKRKVITFTVTDIVFTGIYQFDKDFIYLPIETLSKKLYPDEPKVADFIHIKLVDSIDPETSIPIIRGIFQQFAGEKLNWGRWLISQADIDTAKSMQQRLIAEYRKQLAVLVLVFGMVSCGIILLIFCIFYLIILTKQKDIAIIKSCGLGSFSVTGLFISFGLTIGVAGAALGILAGYYVTKYVNPIESWISSMLGLKMWKSSTYMFSKIPSQVDWHAVVWIAIAATAAAVIGAALPAIIASRIKPVKILRYE